MTLFLHHVGIGLYMSSPSPSLPSPGSIEGVCLPLHESTLLILAGLLVFALGFTVCLVRQCTPGKILDTARLAAVVEQGENGSKSKIIGVTTAALVPAKVVRPPATPAPAPAPAPPAK